MFTGWVYDFLKPHAVALKVAHPELRNPHPYPELTRKETSMRLSEKQASDLILP
ncbi:MAG: hypothetical protein V1736_02915 [Pseudomonadota bacterium]